MNREKAAARLPLPSCYMAASGLLLVVLLLLCLAPQSALAVSPDLSSKLSADEISWLEKNGDSVRYAPNPSWPPGDYTEDGVHKGIVSDYIRIFEERLGVTFQRVYFENWTDILDGLKAAETDLVGAIQKTEEREQYLVFTEPFLNTRLAVLVPVDAPEGLSEKDLDSMVLACPAGYSSTEFIRATYPRAEVVETTDDLGALLRASAGVADGAVVDYMVASYLIHEYGITNLRFGMELNFQWNLRFAIRKDMPVLRSILDKALSTVSDDERQQIYQKWVGTLRESPPTFLDRHGRTVLISLAIVVFLFGVSVAFVLLLKKQVSKRTRDLVAAGTQRHAMLELSPSPIAVVGVDGSLLYANPALARLLGYEGPEALQGVSFMALAHPDSREQMRSGLDALFQPDQSTSLQMEVRVIRKDGGVRDLLATAILTAYKGQAAVQIVVADQTEHKKMEEALRLTQLSVDKALDMIIWHDRDGRLHYANEAYSRRSGYSLEELLNMTVFDLDPELSPEMWLERWEQGREKGSFPFEVTHRTKDGETFPLEVVGHHLELGGEEINVGTARDITERRQMEEQLRLTQLSVSRAADQIHWIDSTGRILYANEASCRRDGYSLEEMLRLKIFDLDPEITPDRWRQEWDRTKEAGSRTIEAVHRTRWGEVYPIEVSVTHVEYGAKEYAFAFVRDITERKQADEALERSQEQLLQAQKMEAVGQLAGGIAHDFNNLLTAVLGYSDLLLAREGSCDPAAKEDIKEIKQAAERAAALTGQILAFSRRQPLRPRVVSLNEVLSGMEPLLRRTLGEDIDLVARQDPNLDNVEVDIHQFEQVLMNLALNARNAMTAGGQLTLETANTELDDEYCRNHPYVTPGSYVMLAVSDTGCGMDEETRAHIFEPFFTTKEVGQGTGLGLAVVYGIVKQSQGSINVYSEPGRGSSFKIYLPRVSAPLSSVDAVAPPTTLAGGRETILVVEDEEAIRHLVARVLGGLGYTVLCAATAEEALAVLSESEGPLDLLLTDVVLPGTVQGSDLARSLQISRPALPVLFMTGYTRNAIVHAGRLAEGVNLLEKPFTPETLVRAVRRVLDRARTLG